MGKRNVPVGDNHDLFRLRLDVMLDPRDTLLRLAKQIDWEAVDRELGEEFAAGETDATVTLTAPREQASLLPDAPGAQVFQRDAGRPALPTRLMIGLHFLKHAFSCSDEDVCEMWKQNPYWQAFTGETHLQWSLPCDPSSLTRWRQRVGEAGVEIALAATIASAKQIGMVRDASFARVVVDTTVQEKAIAHPVDSRLFDRARAKLVRLCKHHDIALRQTYSRLGPKLRRRASGYGHAKQYKRMRGVVRKLKTVLGRVYRDVERKLEQADGSIKTAFAELMPRVKKLLTQQRTGSDKLYALHAPEAECISKGKAHKRYEFGVKVGIAITAKEGLVVGARSFPGRPYDGHTLHEQIEQVESLTGVRPEIVVADRGYRGGDVPKGVTLKHSGLWNNAKRSLRTLLRRRQSIEPHLGHMKSDGRLGRNYLKGSIGDAMNAVLAGAGHNIRLLLNYLETLRRAWLDGVDVRRHIGVVTQLILRTTRRASPHLSSRSFAPQVA